MNEPSPRLAQQPDDLWLLIGHICDGQAEPEEVASLEQHLQASSAARELFVAYLSVHAELQWRHRGSSAVTEDNLAPITAGSPVLGFLSAIAVRPFQSLLGLIVIAATLYYGTFALFVWNLRPGVQPAPEPPALAVHPADRDAACMARIARTSDCQWRFDGQPDRRAVGSPLVAGNILDIASGVVEVEFISGAVVVVDGPTRFRVEAAGRGFLLEGRLLGKVPPPARGFTVDTEDVRVVDLGTEFGMIADGATQVEVFRGEVSLARNQDEQTGIVTTRLGAGDAARVTRDGTVTAVAPRPEGYVGVGGERKLHAMPSPDTNVLTDRFDGREVDASKWLVRTDIPAGGAAVSIESGWLKLVNRGYLVSRADFKPTPERPLRITGTCRIRTGDMLQIITRSDGVPDQQFGEVRQGVEFSFLNLDVDGLRIDSRSPDIGVQRPRAGDQYAVEGKLVTAPSMTLRFEVIDAGTNLSLTLSDLDNPANSETARAQVTLDRAAKHHVVIHNRERGGQEQTLFVSDLRIEQPARSGDPSSSDRPGGKR